jgi:WD40 repeat protein
LVTWSADGKRLAAYVGELDVWDAVTDQLVRKLSLGDKPYSIALSPNGKILAAGINQNIELWDLTTGKKLSTCVGHREYTLELTFSPDGKTLASANIDNTAALWEVPSGKLKFPLTSHNYAVSHLAFSPDGRTLYSGSYDRTVRAWTDLEVEPTPNTVALPPSQLYTYLAPGARFAWSRGDVFAAPCWRPLQHEATSDATLFCMSDEPLQRFCGYLRTSSA